MNKRNQISKILGFVFVFAFMSVLSLFCVSCGCDSKKAEPELQTYSVKFLDYDNEPIGVLIGEDIVYEQKVEEGHSAVEPEKPNRDGYRFSYWSKDFSNITSDVEIYARYVQTCRVSFMNYDGSEFESQIVDYGKNATLPDENPEWNGYRFDHWEGNYRNILADTEIVPVFVKVYTVTFVDFDDKELKVEIVDEGEDATAPADPAREGYIFNGWDSEFVDVNENIVVKATYRSASYDVVFVDYDGTELSKQQVYTGEDATAPDMIDKIYIDWAANDKQGYEFSGWDKDFTNVKQNLTVTAVYQKLNTPNLYVESETVAHGISQTVKVSVYIVSPVSFSGLNVGIVYNPNLGITENDIVVKNIFATQNRYQLNLDTTDQQINFSWTYSAGECNLQHNYAEVFEMQFQVDRYASVGEYFVGLLTSCGYIQDYENHIPILISGAIHIA